MTAENSYSVGVVVLAGNLKNGAARRGDFDFLKAQVEPFHLL